MILGFVCRKYTAFSENGNICLLFRPTVKYFDGMRGVDSCSVQDLLSAGGAWGRDNAGRDAVVVGQGLADGGEKHHLADGE